MAYDSEEWQGRAARIEKSLVAAQEQLQRLARLEEDLAEQAAALVGASGSFAAAREKALRLRALIARFAQLREELDEQLGSAFELAGTRLPPEPREEPEIGGRVVELPPESVRVAALGEADLLLLECDGLLYATSGPFLESGERGSGDATGESPFPLGKGGFRLRRVNPESGLSELRYQQIRGALLGATVADGPKLEPLGRSFPHMQGRFRLRGEWFHLLR